MSVKKERKERKNEDQEKLTQSRLRPVSPFIYVGQGRRGAKIKRKYGKGTKKSCKEDRS
jgi:hypothetical protein